MTLIQNSARLLAPVLNFPLILRIRRNHGLEHATIHMLSRRVRGLRVAGQADMSGFFLYSPSNTPAETDIIWEAAQEALGRMKNGEQHWAVHPNCGTGLVVTSFLTSTAAMLGLAGAKNRPGEMANRLPMVMLLSIIALMISPPLGLEVQRHFTTSGQPGDLELVKITRQDIRSPFGQMTVHRIHTRLG